MSVNEKMKAIADAIREKTNITEPLTLDAMAENIPFVYSHGYVAGYDNGFKDGEEHGKIIGYEEGFINGETSGRIVGLEEGKKAEYDAFWDTIQQNGERVEYSYAFWGSNWKKNTFKPKYDIKPTLANYLFRNVYVDTEEEQIDMDELEKECGIKFDFSNCTNFNFAFNTNLFRSLNVIDFSNATNTTYAIYQYGIVDKPLLKRINKIIFSENTVIAKNVFNYLSQLEEAYFEGTIASSGINLKWSVNLNKASIESFINCLSPSTTGLTITLSEIAVNNAFTTEEWETLAATKSNWTINLL